MSEFGLHIEHETGLFTVAAWTWAGEDDHSLDPYDFPQTIHILRYRGSLRGRHSPQDQAGKYLGFEDALAALLDPCADTRKWAARSIEEALGGMDDRCLFDAALAALCEAVYDPEWSVRAQAVKALGEMAARLCDEEARGQTIQRLSTALLDEEGLVRASAARALDAFNWQPGKDESAASYWVTKRIWQMCVAIGPAAVKPLSQALLDWDWAVRRGAAEALGRIGPAGLQPLLAALHDDVPAVCEAAALSLGRIGDHRAVSELLENLDRLGAAGRRALDQLSVVS